jgi:hypothetical protein
MYTREWEEGEQKGEALMCQDDGSTSMCTYEGSIVKPTKHWLKRGSWGVGKGKYNGGGEFAQGTLHACMGLSQCNPLILLICANSKINNN